jgi:hypothetical protein
MLRPIDNYFTEKEEPVKKLFAGITNNDPFL